MPSGWSFRSSSPCAPPEGIHHLAGNVFEWTLDPFAPYDTLRNRPEEAAQIPRRGVFPETQARTIGFRCTVPAPRANESA